MRIPRAAMVACLVSALPTALITGCGGKTAAATSSSQASAPRSGTSTSHTAKPAASRPHLTTTSVSGVSCPMSAAEASDVLGVHLTKLYGRTFQGGGGCSYSNGANYDDAAPPSVAMMHVAASVPLSANMAGTGVSAHALPGYKKALYAMLPVQNGASGQSGQCVASSGGNWLFTAALRSQDPAGLQRLMKTLCAKG